MYRIGFHNNIFLAWTLNSVVCMKFGFLVILFLDISLYLPAIALSKYRIIFWYLNLLDSQPFPSNSHLDLDSSADCISNCNSSSVQENLVSKFPFLILKPSLKLFVSYSGVLNGRKGTLINFSIFSPTHPHLIKITLVY